MTEIVIAQDAPVLVAIDIAKARHEVLIAIPGKKRRRRLTVLNQMEDFQRLITSLASYGRPVRAAFEATGNYHRAFAYHLATAGFEVKLVSSVALARTREALHNSWDKNDPKDAQVILHMMVLKVKLRTGIVKFAVRLMWMVYCPKGPIDEDLSKSHINLCWACL